MDEIELQILTNIHNESVGCMAFVAQHQAIRLFLEHIVPSFIKPHIPNIDGANQL